MNAENKSKLMSLILETNDITVKFNAPVNGSYNTIDEVIILECNANFIDKLVHNGYSLFMSSKGLSVNHFGVKGEKK